VGVGLDQLGPADFEPLHGAALRREAPGQRLACVRVEGRRLPMHARRSAPPFALILRGPHAPVLPQGTATLVHPVHGPLALFTVPVGPDAGGMRYEITFN
jgi:hypothetical protein